MNSINSSKLLYFNARSIRNKRTDLQTILKTNMYELIFITETWLQSTDMNSILLDNENYCVIQNDRSTHAGGVAIIYSSAVANKIVLNSVDNFEGFELLSFNLYLSPRKHICFVCVYLPPQSSKNLAIVQTLLKALKSLATKSEELYILGDFNFSKHDWVEYNDAHSMGQPLKQFLIFLEEYALHQLISTPTHNSGNILDLVITSHPQNVSNVEVLDPFTSSCDHNTIEIDINHKLHSRSINKPKRNFHAADFNSINNFLSRINWNTVFLHTDTIDQQYNKFLELIHQSIELFVPISKTKAKPFLPKYIKEILRKKRKLYKKSKSNSIFKLEYSKQAKKYEKEIKLYQYHCEQKVAASGNKKVFYNYMKKKLHTRHYVPPLLHSNNEPTLDCHKKANLMNNTFAQVFVEENFPVQLPQLHTDTSHINRSIHTYITKEEIAKSILETKNSVSQTPDDVPSLYIKKTLSHLLEPLQHLFNYSIQHSQTPAIWKTAIVIPIFKKGRTNNPGNYRPISLTSVICRILERIIHKHILTHLLNNSLISPIQHGFITNRSTQTQQLHFLNQITDLYDKNKQTEIIYLDYSKAFDTVSHKKLLYVLNHMKIDPILVKWIEHYLSGRTQATIVDGAMSDSIPVTSGVPQGSVLGPLAFVLYIEDLIKVITNTCVNTTTYAFADDVKLVSTDPDDIQRALNVVSKWIPNWQMNLNTAKSEHMTLRQKQPVDLFICNKLIAKVHRVKDLGITITDNLSWAPYINQIRSKANSLSHNILRLFKSNNCQLLVNLFVTYIRPLLEYNPSSWSPHLKSNIEAIESVQRTFTRRVCQRANITFSGYSDRLKLLDLESLEVRRIKRDLIFLYKILSNFVDVNFSDFFKINNFSSQSLRRHHFHINRQAVAKTNVRHNFFTYRVIKYWNELPEDIVSSLTLDGFKSRLRNWDLKIK